MSYTINNTKKPSISFACPLKKVTSTVQIWQDHDLSGPAASASWK